MVDNGNRQEKISLCVILGGGGHAAVMIDCILSMSMAMGLAVLDSDPGKWGRTVAGAPILGGDEMLPELIDRGATHFAVGLGSTADNLPRKILFEMALSMGLEPLTIMHPSVILSKFATAGPGTALLPGSIVNAGSKVGANVIVNSGAIIEHDCILEDHVHVATGARLASGVKIGSCAHIGIGASIRQGISIGERAVIGAGAVVVQDVASDKIVVGVPARPLKGKHERHVYKKL